MTKERGKLLSILIGIRFFVVFYPIIFFSVLGMERIYQLFDFKGPYESFLSIKHLLEIVCLIGILFWKRIAVFVLLFLDLVTVLMTSVVIYGDQPVKLILNLVLGGLIIGLWNYSIYRKRKFFISALHGQ